MTLTLYTFDWLPEFPRGFVRDLRVRWGLEEIGRSYQVATVPAHPKSAEHRKLQPFTQVPVIQDGEQTLFESGAILVYLCEGTPLLPDERKAEIWQWLFAALNTVELSVMHWVSMILAERVPEFFGPPPAADVRAHVKADMDTKLTALQQALGDKEWLAGDFSVADIAMVEVLRVVAAEEALDAYPHLAAYVERATSRPAFKKAMADHMQHWQAADAEQAKRSTG
ncbi:glutathione S-transferase family protein [Labrenzia sp. R5_0]|jgi:glutathione S-transferase|uniref:glutathione S-transferase family protein n=1 Tax=Labrenzia sp. R5_0 TaxID=2821108 RepID=UPI001ADBBC76|nr:glutathione S-transferase family protein [Labrenzia sp. R5_0]MBO9462082.1 glutathione S-transferase family protein [Labrenzia sp. R5_0]